VTIAPPTAEIQSPWRPWLGLAALLLVVAGAVLPLTDGDSAFYATVARDALRAGEWVVFSARGGGVFDKPPLTTWLLEVSLALFGSADWAVRLWHVGLALATVLVTYHLARLVMSVDQSLLAALILLTSGQFFYQSLVPQQDVPVTLFVTLSMYLYLRWLRDAQWGTAALAGVSTALAVLSKGLFGAALPVLVVAAHAGLDRKKWPRKWVRDMSLTFVAFLLVGAPWFVIAGLRQGQAFVETFLLGGSLGVGRFFHPALSTPGASPGWIGILAYIVFLPVGVIPWTGWLWPGLRQGWRIRSARPWVLRICAIWVVTILAFLTISPGDKVIRYLLPVSPPAAVLIAYATATDRALWTAGRVSLAIGGVIFAALLYLARQPLAPDVVSYRPIVMAFLIPLAAGLVGAGVLALKAHRLEAQVFLVAMALVAYGLLVAATAKQWDQISPWRLVGRTVNAMGGPDVGVLVLGERSPFAEFYIDRPVQFVDRAALAQAWRETRVIAVLPVDALASLEAGPPPTILGAAPGRLLIVRNFEERPSQ
jgi:4-amino-4-deoxy-L-arabinose transferase-like glycosyltransferase